MNAIYSPAFVKGARYESIMTPAGGGVMRFNVWGDQEDRRIHENLSLKGHAPKDQERREKAAILVNLAFHEMNNKLIMLGGGMIKAQRNFAGITKERIEKYSLSTFGAFPDPTKIGVPHRIVFTDADREGISTMFLNLVRVEDVRGGTNRGNRDLNYQVVDIDHRAEWKQYAPGAPINVEGVSYGMLEEKLKLWAAAYQYLEIFEEYQDVWSNDMGMRAMARDYVDHVRKTVESAATDTTGLTPVSYATGGADQKENDLLTFDAGIQQIQTQLFTEPTADGEGTRENRLGPNEPVYAIYNSLQSGLTQRVPRAIAQRFEGPNDNISVGELNRPVIPYGDVDIPLGNQVMLIAPRRKFVHAVGRNIGFESVRDVKIAGVSNATIADALFDSHMFSDAQRVLVNMS